jgi:hypothetical protein
MAALKDSMLLEILNSLFNPIFWPTNTIDEDAIQFKHFTICFTSKEWRVKKEYRSNYGKIYFSESI